MDGDKETPEVAPEAWRFGPAQLFYDMIGVSTDPTKLQYSAVFQRSPEEEDEEPEAQEERDRLLEAAVASILPPEDAKEGWASPNQSGNRGLSSSGANRAFNDNPQQELDQALAYLEAQVMEENSSFPENEEFQQQDMGLTLTPPRRSIAPDDDAFNMVTQREWEKDVIWSPSKSSAVVSKKKEAHAGWIPTAANRTMGRSIVEMEEGQFKSIFSFENEELIGRRWEDDVILDGDDEQFKKDLKPKLPVLEASNEHYIFQMPEDVPPPKIEVEVVEVVPTTSKKKNQSHALKSKLLLGRAGIFQHQQPFKKELQEIPPPPPAEPTPIPVKPSNFPQLDKDFYNISNDVYYQSEKETGSSLKFSIRHSKLVRELIPPFIKTYLSLDELRNFHRPQLSNHNAPITKNPAKRHFLKSVTQRMVKKRMEWGKLLADEQLILLDQPIDLSARDGEILFVENCEEFPPLLSQVGMCSKIVNYCQRTSTSINYRNNSPIPHPYGEMNYVHELPSPYLGSLEGGETLSCLENNLYCSPIYCHAPSTSDFLIIRSRQAGYLIREIDASFTAGQQCPLVEVPEPNSVKARNFLKDQLQAFTFRKFLKCASGERQVNLEDITAAFPTLFESNIKTWLKTCAELKKIGSSTWIVMKPEFVLPTEPELEEMVSPEQCCAYFSMLAAEQRLKDAGCNSMLSLPELMDGDKKKENCNGVGGGGKMSKSKVESAGMEVRRQKNQSKLAEEMMTAPWNTTSAFLAATKGKCLLQIDGPADPTGCGEGFSYVRIAKGSSQQQIAAEKSKKVSFEGEAGRPGGTDADLRRLSTTSAKELLRKAGIPEQEIQKLTRWEIIDAVRTLSTEKAKMGDANYKGISKYSRWKDKSGRAMNQARYKEDCQRVFDVQNKVLSSAEVLSTDEDEDGDEEEDKEDRLSWATQGEIDEMGENIESILNSDDEKDAELLHEREERERVQLQLMMLGKVKAVDAEIIRKEREKEAAAAAELNKKNKPEVDILDDLLSHPGRVLKVERAYVDDEGKTYTRTEIVRDPQVIAAYVKIRQTKSEQFIKGFLKRAETKERREQKQKEQEQANKLKAKQILAEKKQEVLLQKRKRKRDKDLEEEEYIPYRSVKSKNKSVAGKAVKRRGKRVCGKCGQQGHVRTSIDCPMFNTEKVAVKAGVLSSSSGSGSSDESSSSEDESDKDLGDGGRRKNTSSSAYIHPSNVHENGDRPRSEFLPSEQHRNGKENGDEEGTVLKLDGLKMVLKVPKVESLENGLSPTSSSSVSNKAVSTMKRRRISQAEREHSDYLVGSFRTTAADRSARKERHPSGDKL